MSRPFIHDDFLLHSETARWLYHEVAARQPIIDYHCHLSPREIEDDRRFANLTAIWLEGDHYKWRAMRANGIPERLCTGDAPAREKFDAWARTLPMTYRNPLYHWSHLELSRYFGIDELLDERTADAIWDVANERLAQPDFSVHGILKKFRVEVVCTTDDPADSLSSHLALKKSDLATRVFPTFRPDKAMAVGAGVAWRDWVDALAAAAGVTISSFDDFMAALKARHDFFHEAGGRLSDHGLSFCPMGDATGAELEVIFQKTRAGARWARPMPSGSRRAC